MLETIQNPPIGSLKSSCDGRYLCRKHPTTSRCFLVCHLILGQIKWKLVYFLLHFLRVSSDAWIPLENSIFKSRIFHICFIISIELVCKFFQVSSDIAIFLFSLFTIIILWAESSSENHPREGFCLEWWFIPAISFALNGIYYSEAMHSCLSYDSPWSRI